MPRGIIYICRRLSRRHRPPYPLTAGRLLHSFSSSSTRTRARPHRPPPARRSPPPAALAPARCRRPLAAAALAPAPCRRPLASPAPPAAPPATKAAVDLRQPTAAAVVAAGAGGRPRPPPSLSGVGRGPSTAAPSRRVVGIQQLAPIVCRGLYVGLGDPCSLLAIFAGIICFIYCVFISKAMLACWSNRTDPPQMGPQPPPAGELPHVPTFDEWVALGGDSPGTGGSTPVTPIWPGSSGLGGGGFDGGGLDGGGLGDGGFGGGGLA